MDEFDSYDDIDDIQWDSVHWTSDVDFPEPENINTQHSVEHCDGMLVIHWLNPGDRFHIEKLLDMGYLSVAEDEIMTATGCGIYAATQASSILMGLLP